MGWNTITTVAPAKWGHLLFVGILVFVLIGCGSEPTQAPSPTVSAANSTQTSTPEPPAPPTPIPSDTVTPSPTATLEPASPTPIMLKILSPVDGSGIEIDAVRVLGTASTKDVKINGLPVEVAPNGTFQHDLPLQEGSNLIRITASDGSGATKSQQLVVFFVAPTAGLPFTLLYPIDGIEVSEPVISVIGVTTVDAVVGIDETPVEVDSLGIFAEQVALEEGANLLEIVATDIDGNVRFQTLVVFYTP